LTPTSQSFAAGFGNDSFRLTLPAATSWNVTADDPWIHIVNSPPSGTGPATFFYSVDAQTANTARRGTISVAGQTFTVLQGAQFADVPQSSIFYTFIGKLSARGITRGCGGDNYCSATLVTRAQLAVFLERAMRGSTFVPPPAACTSGHTAHFTDVACP